MNVVHCPTIRLLAKGVCYYNTYAGRPLVHWHWQAVFSCSCGKICVMIEYAVGVRIWKKQEAEAMGVPLRRVLAGGKRQLNVNIETYLYNKLKDEAKRKNKTLRDLVIEKLSR